MADETTNGATTPYEDTDLIKQEAADVAEAQGTAYRDVATSQTAGQNTSDYATYNREDVQTAVDDTATIKSGESYIDPDKSTVAGQLKSLLSQDNPYIQNARQRGVEQAASRGMLNTGYAAGQAERAAIESALPVAQQDAQTYAGFLGKQQELEGQQDIIQTEAIVSGEVIKQQAAVQQTQKNIQNAFQAAIAAADAESKTLLTGLQDVYQTGLQQLTHAQNMILQEADITAKRADSIRLQSSSIMQNYQISVENMMTDPDFLNLGAEGVNNAIQQLQTLASNSIQFLGASSGVDMSQFVEDYLTPITVMTPDTEEEVV